MINFEIKILFKKLKFLIFLELLFIEGVLDSEFDIFFMLHLSVQALKNKNQRFGLILSKSIFIFNFFVISLFELLLIFYFLIIRFEETLFDIFKLFSLKYHWTQLDSKIFRIVILFHIELQYSNKNGNGND
jgi:hypothetical protein